MSRQKDEKHCEWIRSLPCIICLDNTASECCHIRYSEPKAAKPITGLGIKPDDCWTLPMCNQHHRQQHEIGERTFWNAYSIQPIYVALALYRVSGDHEAGTQIIEAWQ
jgi:hypothetical protein